MMAVDRGPLRLEQRGECAQLDRGKLRVAERHIDERYLGLVTHLFPRGSMTQPSDSRLAGNRAKRFELAIGFGCHVKITLRQAIDLVGPNLDLALAPGEIEIGMVAFCLCHGSHLVHVGQAKAKSLNVYKRSRWPTWFSDHPRPSSFRRACARSDGTGGTPPRQGIHLLSARLMAPPPV